MGPKVFLQILPLRLVEFDLNSLTFAQDSRSWLLPLLASNAKGRPGADMDFFVAYILPMIMHLQQMRKLELQDTAGNATIKSKKYETLIVQLWELLPLFCK